MRILVTGCKGYVGTVLISFLKEKNYDVLGLDASFFEKCDLSPDNNEYYFIKKDVRHISLEDLNSVDVVIHLAALSNDPMGEFNTDLTVDINYLSTVNLAKISKKAKVKRFIYISSQSMYGISNTDDELDEDNSLKNPVTMYAKTKWKSENILKEMNNDDFTIVCLRPSTVFGKSPRLRCDIVFNNLVACAYTTGKIEIMTDGSPWRPVVHVLDLCKAIEASFIAPREIVEKQSFNVGIKDGNYQVKDLAKAAQSVVPGCDLVFTGEHSIDPRSYKVSFTKIFNQLGDYYCPEWDLLKGGLELVDYFKEIKFTENEFRGYKCNRLLNLKQLISKKIVNSNLEYI